MTLLAERVHSAEEYLALERASDHKSELVDGRIYATTGASMPHNQIVLNVSAELRARLRGRPCRVFANEQRVKVSRTGMYTYPDVVALCDPPRVEDAQLDTLLNPGVIFEVLSSSTEAYDRGEKFAHYRKIESLREYILIAQDQVRVDQFVRHGEHWMLSEITEISDTVRIETLGCEIPLSEIYDLVEFPASRSIRG